MTSFRIGMYTLAFFIAVALAPMIARAEGDGLTAVAKEVPIGGRQRLNPRPVVEDTSPGLMGVPGHDNVAPPAGQGFGPMMSGSPLFVAPPPLGAAGR
jgi:hypothetical protein